MEVARHCRRVRNATLAVMALLVATGCGSESKPAGAGTGGGAAGAGTPNAGGGAGRAANGRRAVQFPVEIRPVESRDVEYRVTAVGSIEAFEIVQVTSRVAGVVETVRFAEGDRVQRDKPLVEIEPERFRLAVESARATLEKVTAARAEAAAGLERREGATARQPGIIPAEEIETWRTRVRTADADVLQARAALDQAELNQHDAYVRAPVAGTIQTRSVQTGAYVQPGTTLATLLRRDPLLLRFNVAEQDAGRLRPDMIAEFKVRESQRMHRARIVHVAAAADPATRMVAVTAHVDVAGGEPPRPGAFAEVTIAVGGTTGAPVVPETAVRPSERGFLAYVVRGGKASERVLQLGMRTSDGLVEVKTGLLPGDSLVVRGSEALRDGAAVRVLGTNERMARPPGAPGAQGAGPSAADRNAASGR